MNSCSPKKLFSSVPLSLVLFLVPAGSALAAGQTAKPQAAAQDIIPLMPAEEFKKQQEWRDSIAAKPQPKKGCFTAKFPSLEWQEVPCVDGPKTPMLPRHGIVPNIVGNGNDIAAQTPGGNITSAIGSFDTTSTRLGLSGMDAFTWGKSPKMRR